MNRATALEILSRHRAEAEQRFGVKSLALFGSVARDEVGPDSDVDVLVEFEQPPGLSEFMALKFWLEDPPGHAGGPRDEGRARGVGAAGGGV